MKRRELQKPLVQSALVLLAAFILIGFVAGSNAQGFFDGIASIVKGAFFTVLFALGLTLALLISVLILIALFLGSVALYSPDTSREMFYALRTRMVTLLSTWWPRFVSDATKTEGAAQSAPLASATISAEKVQSYQKPQKADVIETSGENLRQSSLEIRAIEENVSRLSKENQTLFTAVSSLKASVDDMPINRILSTTTTLEAQQKELSATLADCIQKFEQIHSAVQDNDKTVLQQSTQLKEVQEKIDLLASEIQVLGKALDTADISGKQSNEEAGENGHRIFSYLDKEEHKKQFADLIDEAVEKNMTYTEIDDFLSRSLPKEIDAIVKVHPVLSKEYIRERRQK
jgi:hypothetical protein